jgi:hypothetical protein
MGTKQLKQCIHSIVDKKTTPQIEEIQRVSEGSQKSESSQESVRSQKSESSQESIRSQESVRSSDGKKKKVRGRETFCNKPEFKNLQLEEVTVIGDGNCQFRAIAVLLNMDENNWKDVKKNLLDHFNEEKEFFKNLFPLQAVFDDTKKILMTDGEWSIEPVIRVAEHCYGIQIDIWNEESGTLFTGTKTEHPFINKHTILYNGSSHYNASNDPVNTNSMKYMNRKLKSNNKDIRVIAEHMHDGQKKYFCISYRNGKWDIKKVKKKKESDPDINTFLITDKTIDKSAVIDEIVEPTEDEIKSALKKAQQSIKPIGSSFGKGMVSAKGNKFLESTQKYAALKNMYIVGARLVKPRKYMFLTYRFDVGKKKWVSAKNGKLLGRWLSVRQIKNMKAYKGKVSKECIKSFMSLNYLYPNMNNKNDILLKPLKPRYFGVVKN